MPKAPTAQSVEEWLDALDPATVNFQDASKLRAIMAANKGVTRAEESLLTAVRAARQAGNSWTIIGAALGVTRQRAHQRFAKLVDADCRAPHAKDV